MKPNRTFTMNFAHFRSGLVAAALAAVLSASAQPALAQSADLQQWSAIGDVSITAADAALLTTAWDDESPLSGHGALDYSLFEPAIGAAFDTLGGDTFDGSALSQNFSAPGSVTIAFHWTLTTPQPDPAFADRAFALVDGQPVWVLGAATTDAQSGDFSFNFADAGLHRLTIGVVDVGDAVGVSTLAISGLRVSAVPEPGTWALMLAGGIAIGRLARRRAAR
jgi:hypothetical protein